MVELGQLSSGRYISPHRQLEDEIDDIDEQKEKMKLYKGGYIAGKRVTRNDDTGSGRKSQGYYVYGFKAFTSEKQPDSFKAKGFNERVFVLKCSAGNPDYDISEVISPAGDEEYQAQLDELVDVRKLLFIYRVLHYNEPIPNIKLNLKNRDKQLCKPLLRLFQDTKAVNEIKESLLRLLQEKKGRKANTIDARVYRLLIYLAKKAKMIGTSLNNDILILKSELIWTTFTSDVDGKPSLSKSQSIETAEFGTISRKEITGILKDRFGGEDGPREENARTLKFSLSNLEKLGTNYSSIDKIDIIDKKSKAGKPTDEAYTGGATSATSARCTEDKSAFDNSGDTKNGCDRTANHDNTQENAEDIENITSQESTIKSQSHIDVANLANVALHMESKPIVSIEEFFSNDMPLDAHSLEESPCYPIIGSKPSEIPTDTIYYCKLHPDRLPTTFLSAIENHCRDEPDIHKTEILRVLATATTEYETTQEQHGPCQGEPA
jgi:hypothetical protein